MNYKCIDFAHLHDTFQRRAILLSVHVNDVEIRGERFYIVCLEHTKCRKPFHHSSSKNVATLNFGLGKECLYAKREKNKLFT
jgi:hypothetical protein